MPAAHRTPPSGPSTAPPLMGLRVVEFANLAPVPFAGMLLADLGADVVRVDRVRQAAVPVVLGRGRRSIALNLKSPEGVDVARRLSAESDVLIEGFRPGVMERLGLGPAALAAVNPRLVYARLTGWGQDGGLAHRAGHDVNYIAVSGVLDQIGPADRPPVLPLNLVGDFAGGSMLAVIGILTALHERERSGQGQTVDAAMVDGAALLTTWLHEMVIKGRWRPERAVNFLDGHAPYYATYQTSDHGYVSVGALEPHFYAALVRGLGLDPTTLPPQHDEARWPELRAAFSARFGERTRSEWEHVFRDVDACVYPVLAPREAVDFSDRLGRPMFVDVGGVQLPRPAPRFDRTPVDVPKPAPLPGADTVEILRDLGYDGGAIGRLIAAGHAGAPETNP
jgi:alpha-methylacyl-CoA racemase